MRNTTVGLELFYYPNVKNGACRINKSHLTFPVLSAPVSWHSAEVSLHVPQVYYISKVTLKVANKQYSKVNNDYEMTLHAHSSIVPCDDGHGIPTMSCDFVKIADLENRDKDAIIGESWRERERKRNKNMSWCSAVGHNAYGMSIQCSSDS